MIVRTPLIPSVTATESNLKSIAEFLSGKENLVYYQLLNFNPLGSGKYDGLDMKNDFSKSRPFTETQMKEFGDLVSEYGIRVKVGE